MGASANFVRFKRLQKFDALQSPYLSRYLNNFFFVYCENVLTLRAFIVCMYRCSHFCRIIVSAEHDPHFLLISVVTEVRNTGGVG